MNSVLLHSVLTYHAQDAERKLFSEFMFVLVALFDFSAVFSSGIMLTSVYNFLYYAIQLEIFFLIFSGSTLGFTAVFIHWFIVPRLHNLLDYWKSDWSKKRYGCKYNLLYYGAILRLIKGLFCSCVLSVSLSLFIIVIFVIYYFSYSCLVFCLYSLVSLHLSSPLMSETECSRARVTPLSACPTIRVFMVVPGFNLPSNLAFLTSCFLSISCLLIALIY
ncbi:hypothetical protein COCON_G00171760 [Conger conger]|uniref:Uncharacterized protein n=1 Tax=Conger conger TaxID=82655 RepID=A0A9Q1HUI6_CONCO|nr:hypothetical protein COCON_G00171760 [Conger conger]